MSETDNLISPDIFPLKSTDKCCKALELMNEWSVSHLPVISKDELVGYVSTEDLAFPQDDNEPVSNYLRNDRQYKLGATQTIFDLVRDISESQLSAYAIVNESGQFMGVLDVKYFLRQFSSFISFHHQGGVFLLELAARDYSISEIGRIIESNDMKLIALLIKTSSSEGKIEVLIKVNKTDVRSLLATFARYNYPVQTLNLNKDEIDYLKDRYDSFMKYLDI